MPLILAPEGEKMTVVRVSAETKINRHLHDMGIAQGAEVMLLSNTAGNTVISVKGVRIALDRNIARAIFVCIKPAA